MTAGWNALGPDGRKMAEVTFDARQTMDRLEDAAAIDGDAAARVGIQALFDYATRPETDADQAVTAALAARPALRADFNRILERTALYRFPLAAAASSGAITRRDGEGYTIELRVSRAAPEQTYVSIGLGPAAPSEPRTIVVQPPEGAPVKRDLGPPLHGTIQILAKSDSPLVQALMDPKTEVSLH